MSNNDKLKSLRRQRGAIKAKLTSFRIFLETFDVGPDNVTEQDIINLEHRLQRIKELITDYDACQADIEQLTEDEAIDECYTQRAEFESDFYAFTAKAQRIFNELKPEDTVTNLNARADSDHASQNSIPLRRKVKLPQLKLPQFDGSYDKWPTFHDMFHSIIHADSRVDTIAKFQYLQSSLTGEALKVLEGLEVSSANYESAWNLLIKRYQNKNLMIHKHIGGIIDYPKLSKEGYEALRKLVDAIRGHMRALTALNQPVDTWDSLLIYLVSDKLDTSSKKEWEKEIVDCQELPDMTKFMDFLEKRCQLLEKISRHTKSTSEAQHTRPPNKQKGSTSTLAHATVTKENCILCEEAHALYACKTFLDLPVAARIEQVKKGKACLNCLRLGHIATNCRSQKCKKCSKSHNTLLHLERIERGEKKDENDKQAVKTQVGSSETKEIISAHAMTTNPVHHLLPTAMVKIIGRGGQMHKCYTLLDSGSQSNFMSTGLCKRLGLHTIKVNATIAGINQVETKILETARTTIRSIHDDYKEELTFMIVPKITSHLPSEPLDLEKANVPADIPLADPEFYKPKKIELLIGVDIFWDLMCHEASRHPNLYKTRLGYIVSGRLPQQHSQETLTCNLATGTTDISRQLERFWEVEELPMKRILSSEEQACEVHFTENTKQGNNGRFTVHIPFKASTSNLGKSRELAERRLKSLERRLEKDNKMRNEYIAFMKKYQELGHMTKITVERHADNDQAYYLPHHGVMKESSLTTKLRVVFNASAPTSTGVSINDLQMVGPTIQQDLLSIILCFRQHPYVVGADIAMMYRQVLIHPSQRAFQRILWRESAADAIDAYELNTVTYGMASSAFLAIRCLFSLAEQYQESFPKATHIIRNSMYVDDLLFGASSQEEATQLARDVSYILASGCFELRKWVSNEPRILENLGSSEDGYQFIRLAESETTKTLGLSWACAKDELVYHVSLDVSTDPATKRSVLSLIARLFDPLGLLSPCIIITKMMLQELWRQELSWDDPLPSNMREEWARFLSELSSLNNLRIPRQVCCSSPQRIELHGFSDASEKAYGGCVYIRSIDVMGAVFVRLLCAKTRVAPLKSLTMPKLELSAAHLLIKLIVKVKQSLDMSIDAIRYWSDSNIVLSWIRLEPCRLQTFVRNRVADIQAQSHSNDWGYLPSADNPADLLSRGVAPKLLSESTLWWRGPPWLIEQESRWPTQRNLMLDDLPEVRSGNLKSNVVHTAMIRPKLVKFEDYSKLERLERIMAFCQRFIDIRTRKLDIQGPLRIEEIRRSTIVLVRLAQLESFPEEIHALSAGRPLSMQSKIFGLNPFLHSDNTLRLGGRLGRSDFDFDKKYPMILSSKHHLTKLIFEREHKRLLHVGPQALLAHIRERYWPIAGRNLARQVVHRCIRCFRNKPKGIQPQMADLPSDRVSPSPVFYRVGTDYAGPFVVKDRKGRGCKTYKSYVCLFICLSTKAVHLELVSDLTTENFILALRRFVSRRGKPAKISSDNGTNFVGANSELKRLGEFFAENGNNLQERLVSEQINWSFIPAYSPHFGGIWESGIKSTKHHLRRVVGNALLTFEELYSLLVQIEAVLNSRPLSPLSSHPLDLQPLTPAHFITGRTLTAVPSPDLTDVNETRLSRYQRIQQIQQNFWKRWSKEFISELQCRTKWKSNQGTLKRDDLVLVKEDNSPPLHWQLGRVTELHFGVDNIARAATVRTAKGLIRRATVKLCPLPMEAVPMDSGTLN